MECTTRLHVNNIVKQHVNLWGRGGGVHNGGGVDEVQELLEVKYKTVANLVTQTKILQVLRGYLLSIA